MPEVSRHMANIDREKKKRFRTETVRNPLVFYASTAAMTANSIMVTSVSAEMADDSRAR